MRPEDRVDLPKETKEGATAKVAKIRNADPAKPSPPPPPSPPSYWKMAFGEIYTVDGWMDGWIEREIYIMCKFSSANESVCSFLSLNQRR